MPAKRSTNFKVQSSPQRRGAAPSFAGRRPSSLTASTVKGRNRFKNTQAELELRGALSHLGLRFRLHVKSLPGKPDFVFSKPRVAVFCDGDFWHGRNWKARRSRLEKGSNADYWLDKIAYNIARDKRQTRQLEHAGWLVIRIWETDVLRNPGEAAERVQRLVKGRGARRLHRPSTARRQRVPRR